MVGNAGPPSLMGFTPHPLPPRRTGAMFFRRRWSVPTFSRLPRMEFPPRRIQAKSKIDHGWLCWTSDNSLPEGCLSIGSEPALEPHSASTVAALEVRRCDSVMSWMQSMIPSKVTTHHRQTSTPQFSPPRTPAQMAARISNVLDSLCECSGCGPGTGVGPVPGCARAVGYFWLRGRKPIWTASMMEPRPTMTDLPAGKGSTSE